MAEHQIFAQYQEVFSENRCRGGIYDTSQQADRQIQERQTGVINAAPTMPLEFVQKSYAYPSQIALVFHFKAYVVQC